MKRLTVQITGKTPLLMNRVPAEALEKLRIKEKGTKFKPAEDPRQDAKTKVYATEDGKPYIPTENLLSCLVAGGQFVRLDGKRQMSTTKSTIVTALITLEDPYLPLVDPETGKPAQWEVDMRQGRNPNGGEMVCVVRPRFDRWRINASVLVDDESVGMQKIRETFEKALNWCGLGDYRPSKKGNFGKGMITLWKEEKLPA